MFFQHVAEVQLQVAQKVIVADDRDRAAFLRDAGNVVGEHVGAGFVQSEFRKFAAGDFDNTLADVRFGRVYGVINAVIFSKGQFRFVHVDYDRHELVINAKFRRDDAERVCAENRHVVAAFRFERAEGFNRKCDLFRKNGVVVLNAFGQGVNVFGRHRDEVAQKAVHIEPHNLDVGDERAFFLVKRIVENVRAQNHAFAFFQARHCVRLGHETDCGTHGNNRIRSLFPLKNRDVG